MTCGCSHHGSVSQRKLMTDTMGKSVVHTKASGSIDPTGFLSVAEFIKMENAMQLWIQSLVLETVIEALSMRHMTPNAFYGKIGEILRGKERQIPKKIEEYVEGQVRHGQKIGLGKISQQFREPPPEKELARQMASTVSQFTRSFNETAKNALEGIINRHIEEGLTIDETAKGIQDWASKTGDLERQAKWRATSIARTESARALVNGELAAWKDSGVVTSVRWLISPQPCEFCLAVYRKFRQVGLGENFLTVGQTLTGTRGGTMLIDYENVAGPPLHPHCRCDLEPVVQGQETLRPDPSRTRDPRLG